MKQKSKYQQELEKEPFYNLKDEDFGEEVKFKIDENSFKGGVPFKCHGKNASLINKEVSYGDIDFTYSVIANFIFDFPDSPDKQKAEADLQRSKMSLFPIIQDGKWGFMDSLGNIQIPCAYDWADGFLGGTAVVIRNEKTGYINKAGNIIISLSYDEATAFHNGMAAVKKNNKFGLISKTGQLILPFEFDDISGNESADNIIIALKEGIYKYYDTRGNFSLKENMKRQGIFLRAGHTSFKMDNMGS